MSYEDDYRNIADPASPAAAAPEPVAWLVSGGRLFVDKAFTRKTEAEIAIDKRCDDSVLVPLYTHPAPAVAATVPAVQALTDAARDVLAERQRQISAEGWTPGTCNAPPLEVYPVPDSGTNGLEPGPWMPGEWRPAREGKYLRYWPGSDDLAFSFWRGGLWHAGPFFDSKSDDQELAWRGGVKKRPNAC